MSPAWSRNIRCAKSAHLGVHAALNLTNTSSLPGYTEFCCLEQGYDSLALLHISIAAGDQTVAESPHLLWFQLQGLRTASRMGWQGMVISLIVPINIDGKEQKSIWACLLLSFRPEKDLVQSRTHFPPQLYTVMDLIKNIFHLPTKITLLGTLQP